MALTERSKLILTTLTIYVILAVLLFPYLGFYFDSSDTFQYLSIGDKYASGNFTAAVNGYWSPMLSWLYAPVSLFNFDPVYTLRFVQVLAGGAEVILICLLADKLLKDFLTKLITSFAFMVCILSWAYMYLLPDLLLTVFLTLYLLIIADENYFEKKQNVFYSGFTGALLYFTKAYGFLFFIVSHSVFCLINYFKQKCSRKKIVSHYFNSVSIFILSSSVWIIPLSIKYQKLTLGSASSYNWKIIGPEYFNTDEKKINHPELNGNLADINEAGALSFWEMPDNENIHSWNIFSSRKNFLHFIRILQINLQSYYYFLISRNIGLLFILFLIPSLFFQKKIRGQKNLINILLLFFCVYAWGYLFVFVMPRYLWILYIIMVFYIFHSLELFAENNSFFKKIKLPLIIITFALLVKKPVKEILMKKDSDITTRDFFLLLTHPLQSLNNNYTSYNELHKMINKLKKQNNKVGNCAGIKTDTGDYASLVNSMAVGYYLHLPFYGEVNVEPGMNERMNELKKFKINYLFFWGSTNISQNNFLQHVYKDDVVNFTLCEVNY